MRFRPGSSASNGWYASMMRAPTTPGKPVPLHHLVSRRFGLRIEWLDQAETAWMFRVYLESVAGIVAVHGERRNQQGPVDANRVHRRHHIVASNLIGALQESTPGALRAVTLVRMNLRVNCGSASRHCLALFRTWISGGCVRLCSRVPQSCKRGHVRPIFFIATARRDIRCTVRVAPPTPPVDSSVFEMWLGSL